MILAHHDLIVSAIEINQHHGVGILLQRFFPDSANAVTLRSSSVYGGEEAFGIGHHELRSSHLTLAEIEARLKAILASYRIRRILCVPYYREDFIHGLLAQKLTQAPLCTFVMDDQNIFSTQVPDHWVASLLRASDLCLGISPEMCAAYQRKYGREFHLLPPLVERAEPLVPCYWQPETEGTLKVAMIGNVWTAHRFNQLRALLRETGLQVDWYGNGSAASWLPGTPEEWEADNIRCLGHLPEEDLIASLASYPCILVPSGSLDQDDDNLSFSRLSLPSRLIFLHSRTDTPVLLLGSKESAAGRFVLNLGTGLCSAYQAGDLRDQLARLQDPTEHLKLRRAIRHWAPHFILPHGSEWLWASLARRSPAPATFDAAFPRIADDAAWLANVPRGNLKPERPVPGRSDELSDNAMKSFAFLRTTHLPLLGPPEAAHPITDGIEITGIMESTMGYLVKKLLPGEGNLLVLGNHIPGWAAELPASVTGWRIRDVAQWQQQAFPSETSHLTSLADNKPFGRPDAHFDAIISCTWLHQLAAPDDLARLSSYLTRHTKPGGFNLHAVTAVLNPAYFWTYPAHAHLRAHWGLLDWPGLDEILSAPDLYYMPEATYVKFWQPHTGKSFQDFGKPLGLFLFWRKPLA